MATLTFGDIIVETSSDDRRVFPDDGLTKADVIEYYRRVAPFMLPYLAGRPLTMHRFPGTIYDGGFFHQNAPQHFPEWIRRVTVEKQDGHIEHVVCDSPATLVYLANQNCLTPHVWLSTTEHLQRPDRLIFDLDPLADEFEPVRRGAVALRHLLGELGLESFVMTTGSSGLHVTVPLDATLAFDDVRAFARDVAVALVRHEPDELTFEQRKEKRQGRVFVDTLRNAYGQTAVPPYAVRARPGAPVAAPLAWDELDDPTLHPRIFTVQNLFDRIERRGDPWNRLEGRAQSLRQAISDVQALRGEEGDEDAER
jgi:bifunctional non-homologous end joining protein LigD